MRTFCKPCCFLIAQCKASFPRSGPALTGALCVLRQPCREDEDVVQISESEAPRTFLLVSG